jgi:hypothetical protein
MTIADTLFDARYGLLAYIEIGMYDADHLPEISDVMLAMERLRMKLDAAGVDADPRLPDDAAALLEEGLRKYREHLRPETA